MDNYYLVPDAQQDLESIWYYIARDNRTATDRMENKIRNACNNLAEHPYMGHTRKDLTYRPLRFWPEGS